jgi:hypothetical protein
MSTEGTGPDSESDNTYTSSAKIKNSWSYTYNPPYVFTAWYLIKHKTPLTLRLRNY